MKKKLIYEKRQKKKRIGCVWMQPDRHNCRVALNATCEGKTKKKKETNWLRVKEWLPGVKIFSFTYQITTTYLYFLN